MSKAFGAGLAAHLVIILCVCGCSENGSPTQLQEDPPDFVLEGSETIGAAGGRLETSDFLLTVPSGAFASDQQLELYASDEVGPFGDNLATRTYRLEGIPADHSQPLRVALGVAKRESEQYFLIVGEPGFEIVSGDSSTAYDLVAATDSSGFLVGEILPNSPNPKRTGKVGEKSINLGGLANYAIYDDEDPFFRIYHPLLYFANMVEVDEALHAGLNVCQDDFGLSFTADGFSWPVDVVIMLADREFTTQFKREDDESSGLVLKIEVHPNFFSLPDARRRYQMASMPLMMAQILHDGWDSYALPFRLWLHSAVLNWSEEVFTLDPGEFTQPMFLTGRKLAPFKGMSEGAGNSRFSALNHGEGMSSFIKYLANTTNWEAEGLRTTYEGLRGQLVSDALFSNFTNSPEAVWMDYMREYVGGNLYGVHPDTFMAEAGKTATSWTVSGPDDTLKVFDSSAVRSYPEMSARMFAIRLNYPTIDEAAQIQFQASSDDLEDGLYSVIVFAYKPGHEFNYIGQAQELRIADIRALHDEGYTNLLAVLANGHSFFTPGEISDIYLVVKVIEPDPITECLVWAKVWSSFSLVYFSDPDNPQEGETEFQIGAFQREGTWTDTNTFSVTWDEVDQQTGNSDEIRITIILDETRDNIERLDVYRHLHWVYPVYRELEEVLTAFDIPRYHDYYRIDGLVTTDHISEFESTEDWDESHYEAVFPISSTGNMIEVKFF
jgi:hypothetical protein